MDAMTPVIYLLSAGADPTDSIETLARRKRKEIECVSMGEGQDIVASRAITSATSIGSWKKSYLNYVHQKVDVQQIFVYLLQLNHMLTFRLDYYKWLQK
eukprot:scaffold4392_cov187-Ochromonas_danica.AAC.6